MFSTARPFKGYFSKRALSRGFLFYSHAFQRVFFSKRALGRGFSTARLSKGIFQSGRFEDVFKAIFRKAGALKSKAFQKGFFQSKRFEEVYYSQAFRRLFFKKHAL